MVADVKHALQYAQGYMIAVERQVDEMKEVPVPLAVELGKAHAAVATADALQRIADSLEAIARRKDPDL